MSANEVHKFTSMHSDLCCIALHKCFSHDSASWESLVDGNLQAVMLDEVMKSGTRPQVDHLLQFETRSLRDTRQLLSTVSLADTLQFVEQNPHPRYFGQAAQYSVIGCHFAVY